MRDKVDISRGRRTLSLPLFRSVALRSFFTVHHICTSTYTSVKVLISFSLGFFFVLPILSRTKQLVMVKRERKQVANLTEVSVIVVDGHESR